MTQHPPQRIGEGMSERIVAEFFDRKLTGVGAMERFAQQEGRLINIDSIRAGDVTFRFEDGVKTYKPVLMHYGWQIVVVKEA